MKDLIERLSTGAMEYYLLEYREMMRDAADAIEKLEAENAALKAELAAMRIERLTDYQKLDIVTNWFASDDDITRAMQVLTDFEQTSNAAPGAKP